MKRLALIALLASPAVADRAITVQLPDDAKIAEAATAGFLSELALAEVVGVNCPDYRLTKGEAELISGTVDLVADIFDLNPETRAQNVYGPAFALLDQPGTCDTEGPKIAPLVEKLKAMGGGTDPLG
ncbi:hypothetical protein [Tabrizicola sp.]|uniref:hypothetical protein n=1 Tax=Tabrizicola sp. TaxID=2005166 RepID=UPI00286D1D35|nr:hypothetical protein [Tabrizicola sp.]